MQHAPSNRPNTSVQSFALFLAHRIEKAIGSDKHLPIRDCRRSIKLRFVAFKCIGALSFTSNKFENRAPQGKTMIRCFIGGALQGDLVDLPDEDLINIATHEVARMLGLDGSPELQRVFRWRNCMPQYHLGHLERVASIESLVEQHQGLEVTGNSYRGVGVPACLQFGCEAAERLFESLSQ